MKKDSKLKSMKISKLPAAALVAMTLSLFLSGTASAMSTVTVDGIKQAGEYTGDNSGSISLLWYNNHHSIYTEAAGNMNPLDWEINQVANGKFSLNVFFEVPTYARRMIWATDCKYKSSGTFDADCAPLAPGGDTSYLDAYLAGSHHDDANMSYSTQTGSEFFELDGITGSFKKNWQDEDGNGLDDDVTWATSREYLIKNNICDTNECTQFDQTSSIEVMWQGLDSADAAAALRDSIDKMQLHLSDEATGLPPVSEVPVPAAFWLFGTALIGFIGMSRRTNLS
ncbi:VPLPA-CTERM sorting domain-containing protein [Gammaproteobacteria bacterium]|nr:VPLPA-CTERM sorting domain-containing protein [Gammaproteobacteria bacterium]